MQIRSPYAKAARRAASSPGDEMARRLDAIDRVHEIVDQYLADHQGADAARVYQAARRVVRDPYSVRVARIIARVAVSRRMRRQTVRRGGSD